MSESRSIKNTKVMCMWTCFGVSMGCGIGVVIGNLTFGIGPGAAIGVAIGILIKKSWR